MDEILTRCGYRCDLCLAYRPAVEENPSNRQALSDGWFKYFGFRIEPENIMCDGCLADHPKLIDQECPVRPCVLEKGLDNCGYCDQYICEKLKDRIVEFETIRERLQQDIPEEDRRRFILPYESKLRLERIRLREG